MLLKALDENVEIIKEVLAQHRNKEAKGNIEAETFIRQYYSQVDPEDLAERTISNLSALLWRIWISCESSSPVPQNCAFTIRKAKRTDGSPRIRSSRSSMTTCRSWWSQ